MATKKAAASKKSTSATRKKPTAKRSVKKNNEVKAQSMIIQEEVVEIVKVVESAAAVEAETTLPKRSFKEKLMALKPGALIAEFLGTFVLAGAVINLATSGVSGQIGIALIFAVLVIVFGAISGAHLNPAITIAKYVNRRIDGVKTVAYLIVQVLGAMAAFCVLYAIWQNSLDAQIIAALATQGIDQSQIDAAGSLSEFLTQYGMTIADAAEQLGVTFINSSLTAGQEAMTFLAELIGAIVFGLGIGYVTFADKAKKIEKGLVVGISLLAGLIVGGATVILNPAIAGAVRAFAWANPFGAEAMTFWWPVFIYIGATVIGMTIGVTAYRFILKDTLAKKA